MSDNGNDAPTLRSCIDPFSPRVGQRLEWKELNLSAKKKGNPSILKSVSGIAKPGELTCIMGASGSGKTSLLQVLGGRSSQYKLEGAIYLDGTQIDPTSQILQKKVGYIGQFDKLLATSTPHGRIMYHGRADRAIDRFASKGYPMPRNYNPADWLLQVPLDEPQQELEKSGFFEEVDGSSGPTASETFAGDLESDHSQPPVTTCDNDKKPGASVWTQTKEQLKRDVTTMIRDKNAFLGRYIALAVMSTLVAISFTFVGRDSLENQISFSSHVGALFLRHHRSYDNHAVGAI